MLLVHMRGTLSTFELWKKFKVFHFEQSELTLMSEWLEVINKPVKTSLDLTLIWRFTVIKLINNFFLHWLNELRVEIQQTRNASRLSVVQRLARYVWAAAWKTNIQHRQFRISHTVKLASHWVVCETGIIADVNKSESSKKTRRSWRRQSTLPGGVWSWVVVYNGECERCEKCKFRNRLRSNDMARESLEAHRWICACCLYCKQRRMVIEATNARHHQWWQIWNRNNNRERFAIKS